MSTEYIFIFILVILIVFIAFLFFNKKNKKQREQKTLANNSQKNEEEYEDVGSVKVTDSSMSQEDYYKERMSYLVCYKNLLSSLKSSQKHKDLLKYQLTNDRFINKIDSYVQNENKLISSSQRRHPKTVDDLVLIIDETLENIKKLNLEDVSSLDMFNFSNISTSLNFLRSQYIDLVEVVLKIPEYSDFMKEFELNNKIYKPEKQQEQINSRKEQVEEVKIITIDYEEKYKTLLLESERISLDLESAKHDVLEKESKIQNLESELVVKGDEIKSLEGIQKNQTRQISLLSTNLENIKRRVQAMETSDVKSELSNMIDLSDYVDKNKYFVLEGEHKKIKSRQTVIIGLLSFIALLLVVGVVVIFFQNKTNDIIYNNKKAVEANLESVEKQKNILIEIIKRDVFIQLERYDFSSEVSLLEILEAKNSEYDDILKMVETMRSENNTKSSTIEKLRESRDSLSSTIVNMEKDILLLERQIKEKTERSRVLREESSVKDLEILELERQIKEKQSQIDLKKQELGSITVPHTSSSEVITQTTPTT